MNPKNVVHTSLQIPAIILEIIIWLELNDRYTIIPVYLTCHFVVWCTPRTLDQPHTHNILMHTHTHILWIHLQMHTHTVHMHTHSPHKNKHINCPQTHTHTRLDLQPWICNFRNFTWNQYKDIHLRVFTVEHGLFVYGCEI